VVAYGWWATGLEPFTATAYAAVAVSAVALVLVSYRVAPTGSAAGGERRDAAPRLAVGRLWPWLVLGALAVALEVVGLALGGRSPTVPTLSTFTDHALAWHGTRLALFLAWLAVGWWSTAVRVWRGRRAP